MPASPQEKVEVACPHCGHRQAEPRTAISTNCRQCRKHFTLQEALHPAAKVERWAPERRKVACFECGTELEVPVNAESTMCKRCSRHMDLRDYHITNAVSKNFKTRGAFLLDPKGYVFNTEVFAGEAILKGRFLGKLVTERSLTIYSTAEIKGSFKAGQLVIPAENHFRWPEAIRTGAVELAGELAANLHVTGTVVLKATARLFGNVEAGGLVVEPGAVVVGQMRIGSAQLI